MYVCMYVNHSYRIDIILILIVHTFDIFVILLKTDTEYMTVHFVFVTSNQTICFESQLYLKVWERIVTEDKRLQVSQSP